MQIKKGTRIIAVIIMLCSVYSVISILLFSTLDKPSIFQEEVSFGEMKRDYSEWFTLEDDADLNIVLFSSIEEGSVHGNQFCSKVAQGVNPENAVQPIRN